MPITMKDVAREAGVSLGTVSNFINGKSSIKEANKARIEEAIEKLGYEVNEVARNLKLKHSNTIGVLIPSFGNVFAVRTISYLERYFRDAGYELYVSSYDRDPDKMESHIVSLIGKKIDGLVLMPSMSLGIGEVNRINSLIDKKVPVVIFDSTGDGVRCDHVVLNNYNAIKEATKYLVKAGHKRIAAVLGPENIYSTEERRNGFLDGMKDLVKDSDTNLILYTDYSKRQSKDMINTLLTEQKDVTAILSAGYRITLGTLAAFNELKASVPNDISVLGFDISEIGNILPYDLTGITIPTKEVAKEIVETITQRRQVGFEAPQMIKGVELKFLEGDSVKAI